VQIPWDMHSNEEIEQNLRFGMRLPEIVCARAGVHSTCMRGRMLMQRFDVVA